MSAEGRPETVDGAPPGAAGRAEGGARDREGGHPIPFRQASRLWNEFQLDLALIASPFVEGSGDRAGVLLALLRQAADPDKGLAVRSIALARALSRPTETVRRHVNALVLQGHLLKVEGAFQLAPELLREAAISRLIRTMIARFRRLIVDLDVVVFPGLLDTVRLTDAQALRALLDVYLAVFELTEARSVNSTEIFVMGAISVINASAITHDPELSRLYGAEDAVPPRELRRPASLNRISGMGGLSYATAGRHADRLAKAGVVESVEGGFLIAERWMTDPRASALTREKILHLRRVLTRPDDGERRLSSAR